MRKTKIELKGTVTVRKDGNTYTRDLKELGSLLLPCFSGRMNSILVNNQLFIIQMQSEGIRLGKVFHYKTYKDREEIIKNFLKEYSKKIYDYIDKHYEVSDLKFEPVIETVYDVDYCELPIQEAQADLNTQELRELIKELKDYQPTSHILDKKRIKKNILFD